MRANPIKHISVAQGLIGLLAVALVALVVISAFSKISVPAFPQQSQNLGVAIPSPVTTVQPTVTGVEPTAPVETVQATPALPQSPPQLEAQLSHDYGAWSFNAGESRDMGIGAVIRYDDTSLEGIRAYVLANEALAKQLAPAGGQASVDITFRNFITPDKFRAWAIKYGLRVTDVEIRVKDARGMDGTLAVSPQSDDPLSQADLDGAMKPQEKIIGGPGTITGVYYTSAKIDAKKLPTIAADPLVLLADVTANEVRKQLANAGWVGVDKAGIRVNPPTPFFKMEELGLQKFSLEQFNP